MTRISEAGTVQFPMLRHAEEVGWVPLGPADAQAKRGGESGLFFLDELSEALTSFNPWLTPDDVRRIVEKLESLPATIEGNRAMLGWLRGEESWYDERERLNRRVQLVDFDRPEANTLQVTWEWRLRPPARKANRADLMFVVNGVPVCIVEHKNPTQGDAIDRGVTQLRRYEIQTPELLGAAQLFNVTHLVEYWYGVTWNASRRYMARWKERREETYKFAVQSFFEPTDFLRTLRHWILFWDEDGETRKSVLRQHQRLAVEAVVERCADPRKSRGLVWHTQGSGKTFTLLTAARLVLEQKDRFRKATVILVVDRTELEGQLKGWVDRLLGELQRLDIPVARAESRDDIEQMLRADRRGLILAMIHKFDGIAANSNTRDNVFVFIDEAHRSVAKELGTYLMAAVPNATLIGFTGTPIAGTEHGKGTFKIFGAEDDRGYLHKYPISESIEDETTLPIRHSMAPSEMTVPADRLDKEFFALAAAEDVTDVDELNRVLDDAVALKTFLTADDRIEKVARFVAKHFRETVLPLGYKAFLVGVNREACAKYKRALDRLLPPEWTVPVYTANANDAVLRPLVAELQVGEADEAAVRSNFKSASKEPKILIVTDKLLTGFDAPVLGCMYLDKPMRNHVLLQAIARVNRPYVDAEGVQKRVGLVVDFVGVLRELKNALQFDSNDVSGVIEGLELLLPQLLERLATAERRYLPGGPGSPDEKLEQLVYGQFLDAKARLAFFEEFKDIEDAWEVLSPSAELREHIETYQRLARLYTVVRNAYADRGGYTAELGYKTRQLVSENARSWGLERIVKTVTFDAETLREMRDEPGSDEGKVFNLVRGLTREIVEQPESAPLLQSIRDRADRVLQDMEHRQITALAAMDQLEALARDRDEALRAARESGLSARAFAVQWALRDDSALRAGSVEAGALARECEAILARFKNAAVNTDEQRKLRAALYRPLLALAPEERGRIVDVCVNILLDGIGDAR